MKEFKYTKESVLKLKESIKSISSLQKDLKKQRKTVYFSGERWVGPSGAYGQHRDNRTLLMHMYIAYSIMRNKDLDGVMPKSTEKFSQSKVDKIIKEYGEVICAGS